MKRFYSLLFISIFFVFGLFVKDVFALSAGTYSFLIQPTPTKTQMSGTETITRTIWGKDPSAGGRYRSSFSFGKTPGPNSQLMMDNNGDGWAGRVVIVLDGAGNFTVSLYQKDNIWETAGGTFSQFANTTALMNGTIDGFGNIVYNPVGRLGNTAAPVLLSRAWNIDDFTDPLATTWLPVNTTSATAILFPGTPIPSFPATVLGTPIWTDSAGDVWAVMLQGGQVGSAWGDFFGATFYEVWRVKIQAENPCDFADCSDGDQCTDDVCTVVSEVAVCSNPYNTSPCDDGTYCTIGDTCDGAGTCVGTAPDCDDGIACTTDTCDNAIGCVNTWNSDTSCLGTPWVTTVPGGEIVFWDWGYTGPNARGPSDFGPINGFGGPNNFAEYGLPNNLLDPSGGIGQIQHVETQYPDWKTPDALYDFWGDLFDITTYFPDGNVDGTVNFSKSGYTMIGGSTFDPMYIDYDGDYLVPQAAMNFLYFDIFDYRDEFGTPYVFDADGDGNPDPNPYDSQADFQPFPISDGIGWCGSVLANHPVAMEPMAGQITFDIVMEAYFPFHDLGPNGLPDPGEGSTQIIPNFKMGSYGTLEVKIKESLGGVYNLYYRADAVVNNTSPTLGRNLANPMGFTDMTDPTYYNHVSFMGGDVVPSGVWLNNDGYIGTSNNQLITVHPVQGADGTYDGEIRDPGGSDEAYWHVNGFSGFPFLLRADGIRYPDYFDVVYYGADTDDDGVQDDADPSPTGDAVLDNCINEPNGPKAGMQDAGGNVQRDTNGDGYGNICDADLNNDNNVNSLDLGLFKAVFMTSDADANFNGDSGPTSVNFLDLGIIKALFMQPPGPSGVAP